MSRTDASAAARRTARSPDWRLLLESGRGAAAAGVRLVSRGRRGCAGAWGLAGSPVFALVVTGQMVIPQTGVGPVSVTSAFAEASP